MSYPDSILENIYSFDPLVIFSRREYCCDGQSTKIIAIRFSRFQSYKFTRRNKLIKPLWEDSKIREQMLNVQPVSTYYRVLYFTRVNNYFPLTWNDYINLKYRDINLITNKNLLEILKNLYLDELLLKSDFNYINITKPYLIYLYDVGEDSS